MAVVGTPTSSSGGTPSGTPSGNPPPPSTPNPNQRPPTPTQQRPISYATPKVGDLDSEGIPWTGGEPLDDKWSASVRTRPHSRFAMRGKQDFRQYTARIKGLETKFKKVPGSDGMGLQDFESEVQRHLEVHGMDSVFWQKSPLGELLNIVNSHSLFSIQSVLDSLIDMDTKYDEYDRENLTDAGMFLLASIDTDIKTMINPYLKSEATGPEIWIRIVHEVQSSSVERMIKVKEVLSKCRVRSFKGDDVKQYAKYVMQICRDLENGQELPKHAVVMVVDQLIEVPVEKFRMEFLGIRPAIIEQMNHYHGKTPRDIKDVQIKMGFYTYENLLSKATLSYQTLLDLGQWGPAGHIKDRLGAPEAMFTSVETNALSQKAVANFKKNQNKNSKPIVCYFCGKPGHKKTECRSFLNQSGGNNNNNNTNNYNRNNSNNSNNNNGNKKFKKSNWKARQPRGNEPETKTVDGDEYHWCAKCGKTGRWTLSHGTSEHRAGTTTQGANSNNRRPETNSAEIGRNGLYCNWDTDWEEAEANMVHVLQADRYRTLIGDNIPEDIIGLFHETDDGGDVIDEYYDSYFHHYGTYSSMGYTYMGSCETCSDPGNIGHWCGECQDGSLYVENSFDVPACNTTSVAVGTCTDCGYNGPGICTICGTEGIIGFNCTAPACQEASDVFPEINAKINVLRPTPNGYEFRPINCEQEEEKDKEPELCYPKLGLQDHCLYTMELTVLLWLNWMNMLIESKDIVASNNIVVTFEKYYMFNCMFMTQVGLSWMYLLFRIIERLTFYVLFECFVNLYPFVEQARIFAMEYFLKKRIRQGPSTPRTLEYSRKDKFDGPSIPLISRCVQVIIVLADPSSCSMQTAYGMLGRNWEYFGIRRMTLWSYKMKFKSFEVSFLNEVAQSFREPKESKRKKRMQNKKFQEKWSIKPHHNSTAEEKASRNKSKEMSRSFEHPDCFIVEAVGNMSDLFQRKGMNESNELLWDTGATLTVTPYLHDFVSPLNTTSQPKIMKGIAKGLSIEGIGTVEYTVLDDNGKPYTIRTQAYFTPDAKRRIFSPQSFLQDDGGKGIAIQSKNEIKLQLGSQEFTIKYSSLNNLPILLFTTSGKDCDIQTVVETLPCITESTNKNLTEAQRTLLKYHFRLGHVNMAFIQMALRSGYLGESQVIKAASKCEIPMCPTCKFAKAKRRSTGYQHTKVPVYRNAISTNILRPGQKVSMDHFSVTQRGRLFESKGKTPENVMYTCGCLFYDHASQYVSVKMQVHKDIKETVQAKLAFEREMFQYGVIINSYHTDNGIFSTKDFISEIENNLQGIRFSGVGGQHQNGAAERAIGSIFGLARAMLIHFAIRWPEVFDVSIWPMALLYAKWVMNHVPKANGIAPIELVVRSKTIRNVLNNAHVLGCPCYVLDPKLQDLGSLPKFQARSKRGMFVGFSPKHSSLVPLVLNLTTLSITPQYHVVFDDYFQTVDSDLSTDAIDWDALFEDRYHYDFGDDDVANYIDDWNIIPEGANDNIVPEGDNDIDPMVSGGDNDTMYEETSAQPFSPNTISSPTSSSVVVSNNNNNNNNNNNIISNDYNNVVASPININHNNNIIPNHFNNVVASPINNNNNNINSNSFNNVVASSINNINNNNNTPTIIRTRTPTTTSTTTTSFHPTTTKRLIVNDMITPMAPSHGATATTTVPTLSSNTSSRIIPQQETITPRNISYRNLQREQQRQRQLEANERHEVRRSTRTRRPPSRYTGNGEINLNLLNHLNTYNLQQVDFAAAHHAQPIDDESIYAQQAQYDDDGSVDYVDPSVFLQLRTFMDVDAVEVQPETTNNVSDLLTHRQLRYRSPRALMAAMDNDTLRYHEAMCQADWDEFRRAAALEIKTLEEMGTWKEVPRSSVPKNKKVLGGTWVFKRKRTPEGKIAKYKARYCVRGDQQVAGVDYFESYAPVCMWYTIRMMFILSIIFQWHSCQVDYTNAFAQAFLKEVVYMEIPQGFSGSDSIDKVLLLIKSLYGLVQAPKTFYDLLTTELTRCGYVNQPNIDPCLWINKSKKIMCVIWVDDCLFFCKDKKQIDISIKELSKFMPLTKEDSVTAFLGIKVERNNLSYTLSQPGLIQKIIEAVDMVDCNSAKTPAATVPISTDPEGLSHNETWEYRSLVGMLMFLANNTRPDIAYATHQCARFSHSPKASHSLAIKRIVRYLKGTSDMGIIMTPTKTLTVDCYVDADFAGLFGAEDSQNSICAKSRTGYVIFLANCPLMWVSKMQSEIASSTMESEYIALSQSMRDLIPVRRLLQLICDTVLTDQKENANIYSSVFEDNSGALQLARAPRITPRTKHYAIKYHFFREYVKQGQIKLFKIETTKQRADIFTKGLVQAIFETIRKLLMGW